MLGHSKYDALESYYIVYMEFMHSQLHFGIISCTSKWQHNVSYVLFRKYSIFRRLQKLGPYLTCITLLFKYCIGQPRHNVKYDFEYLFDFHVFHSSWGLVLLNAFK